MNSEIVMELSEEIDSTVGFGADSDTAYLEVLQDTFGGSWTRVENAQTFECDLGHGMCHILIEYEGNSWRGKLSAVNPSIERKTDPCDDLEAVILRLRVFIRDHGLELQEKADQLIEIAAEGG